MENVEHVVETAADGKRVTFEKISIVPTPQRKIDGEPTAEVTVVVTVHDNPVWLAPLLWGAVTVTGVVGGYFLIDKVQEFVESPMGKLITIGAAVFSILLAWKALS